MACPDRRKRNVRGVMVRTTNRGSQREYRLTDTKGLLAIKFGVDNAARILTNSGRRPRTTPS